MSAATSFFRTLPYAQYKRHRTFYLWYDTFYGAAALAGIGIIVASDFRGVFPAWDPMILLFWPVFAYVLIMGHVFCHNASHGSFPKAINRVVGELAGALVLTKFASWEIVHRRHHRYSDDPERDPHPAERSYWTFAKNTLINVEKQFQQSYFDIYGDTPETRRYEKIRSFWSFVTGSALAAFWFFLFGAPGFFLLFLPASVAAGLFVIHFNWAGHNAHRPDGEIKPVDLDYGWYWLGNRIFFGIYFHGTHHKLAMLFNPMKAPKHLREKLAREQEKGVQAAA